jgi:hypothetical protein
MEEKMFKILSSFFVFAVLTLAFNVALTVPASAQTQSAEAARMQYVMDANSNIEEFRQELLNYFMEMEDTIRLFNEIRVVREKLNKNGLKPLGIIAEAKNSITNARPEDLRHLRDVYAKFPGWRSTPQSINALLKPEFRQQLETQRSANKDGGDVTPNAVTPDNCQDGINADVSNTDIAAAQAASLAAHAVADAVPPILNIPAVAAYVVTDAIVISLETLKAIKDDCTGLDATAVQTIVDNAKTQIINNDNSNRDTVLNSLSSSTTSINNNVTNSKNEVINNDNGNKTMLTTAITNATTTIVNNDNGNKTMIVNNDNANALTLNTNLTNTRTAIVTNDNTNTTNIVNNDNTNRTAIINNANANTTTLNTAITNAKIEILNNANTNRDEGKNLLLRTQIEAALASTRDDTSVVGLYGTPVTVCFPALNSQGLPQTGPPSSSVQCGLLDLVRSIVNQTIVNISGPYLDLARRDFAQGDDYRANGYYKRAYVSYRKAYQFASVVESIPVR